MTVLIALIVGSTKFEPYNRWQRRRGETLPTQSPAPKRQTFRLHGGGRRGLERLLTALMEKNISLSAHETLMMPLQTRKAAVSLRVSYFGASIPRHTV